MNKNINWEYIKELIPPIINIRPFIISEKNSIHSMNPYVWEQPMSTELYQYKLHATIPLGENIDKERRLINTYLAIPWGRFDAVKFYFPLELIDFLKEKIKKLKDIVSSINFTLKIHTVCQKENWKCFIPLFEEIGLTDIHTTQYESIYTPAFNEFKRVPLTFHCLPFEAVNTVNKTRNQGLTFIDINKRKYIASFKGAHMPHYKSDVRLLLKQAWEKESDQTNIYIEILNEWFYNKEMFFHFYESATKVERQKQKNIYKLQTKHYNMLMSNSIFTLCPEGGGINSIRFWEAMSVGSIPVLITSKTEIPLLLSIHPELYKCCYVVFRKDIFRLFKILREKANNKEKILEMSNKALAIYEELSKKNTFMNQYNMSQGLFSALL